MEQVYDHRCVGDRQEARRPHTTEVEMLEVSIEGDGEQTARLPPERPLLSLGVPHRRGAPPFDYVDHLFEKVTLGVQATAWRDLTHVGVVGAAGTLQIDVRAATALARPRADLHCLQILDRETPDNRNAFAFEELRVTVDAL